MLIALAAGLVLGCVPPEEAPVVVDKKPDVAGRKARAKKLERQGKLIDAIDQWKVLRAVAPNDREVSARLESARRRARELARTHFEKGETEIKRRRFNSARAHYITALAYDPKHELARKRLLDFELVRNRRSRPRIDYEDRRN